MNRNRIAHLSPVLGLFLVANGAQALSQATEQLASQLVKLDARVLQDWPDASQILEKHVQKGLAAAGRRSAQEWQSIASREQWESFTRRRLAALRASLGEFPQVQGNPQNRITKTLPGDGFVIENLVFESRPGLWVTANLYRPDPRGDSMPGLLICHSHHNPKSQGELQDMGMTWARLGCAVLVMDQLGHGERRQHPFVSAQSYAGEFPVGRQDYHFRYNTGIQLHLIGDSLAGWMAWDLRRGVDLLLSRPGIDPQRIVLMGSVAGGGDPAAVAASLDPRITVAVPFNFGGPQPETPYPLPPDAENTFEYAGSGSWESTRNLRLSCRDGFLPWVIVGSIAPRYLVYAHEFSWDQEHDPVWKRLRRIYADFYGKPDSLDYTQGFGVLQGKPPHASHCNNVGAAHRERIHAALKRWFGIPGGPAVEYQMRRSAEDLTCLGDEAARELEDQPLFVIASQLGHERVLRSRAESNRLAAGSRLRRLQLKWQSFLGPSRAGSPRVLRAGKRPSGIDGFAVEEVVLETEVGIPVPLLVLKSGRNRAVSPIVLALGQSGKAGFLRERSGIVARLLRGGAAVCLPDLRGTGETRSDAARGRQSADTAISSTALMLGDTLVGARLRDARAILEYLRTRSDLDARRIAVWGDSFSPANPRDRDLRIPLGIAGEPRLSEPLGGMLALLTALYETDVRAVYARGGLSGFESVLRDGFCYIPHDVVIPGVLTAGDLSDVAAALAPRPVRLEGLVDGLNRGVPVSEAESEFAPARAAYGRAAASGNFVVGDPGDDFEVAQWLLKSLSVR
jgi:cephalosporin-C deacetylase-like acetyl esterase